MTTTKLDQKQLAELTRRAYERVKQRTAEEIIESKQVALDDAVDHILDEDQTAREQCNLPTGLTEEDICMAYEEMNGPSLGKRMYNKAVYLALHTLKGTLKGISRPVAVAYAAIGYTILGLTSGAILNSLAVETDARAEVRIIEGSDVLHARKAIAEAYVETNAELRRLKLQKAVTDFYAQRTSPVYHNDLINSNHVFTGALVSGIPANDLVSIIDTVCPLQQGDGNIASCGMQTAGNNWYFSLPTAAVIADYAETTHVNKTNITEALRALDDARLIVVARHTTVGANKPSLYEMPGLIIRKARQILYEIPSTNPAGPRNQLF